MAAHALFGFLEADVGMADSILQRSDDPEAVVRTAICQQRSNLKIVEVKNWTDGMRACMSKVTRIIFPGQGQHETPLAECDTRIKILLDLPVTVGDNLRTRTTP